MEIDWCQHHTEWADGCKYCGPDPEQEDTDSFEWFDKKELEDIKKFIDLINEEDERE